MCRHPVSPSAWRIPAPEEPTMHTRTRQIPLLVTIVAILWPTSSSAQAFTEIAFGPRQYTRSAGRPEGVVETFRRCGTGPCRIVVMNGDADHRVGSAVILLN